MLGKFAANIDGGVRDVKEKGLLLLAQIDVWHKTIRLRTEHTTRSTQSTPSGVFCPFCI